MELRNRIAEEFDKMKEGLLVFAVLLGFGFFINQGVELKGLYMDDLYLWSCYGEQTFREFVFPMGSTRFRFVFYLAAWLEIQTRTGNFPSLPEGKIPQKIEAQSTGYLFTTGPDTGKYQIQCRLQYFQEV